MREAKMRLYRTDLVPVLAIILGGAVGAATTGSFLWLSSATDAPIPATVVPPSVTVESANVERLPTSGRTPTLSPDGQWLAYTTQDGNEELWIVNVDGGTPSRFTVNTSQAGVIVLER
jgi:hypothetical protein